MLLRAYTDEHKYAPAQEDGIAVQASEPAIVNSDTLGAFQKDGTHSFKCPYKPGTGQLADPRCM